MNEYIEYVTEYIEILCTGVKRVASSCSGALIKASTCRDPAAPMTNLDLLAQDEIRANIYGIQDHLSAGW